MRKLFHLNINARNLCLSVCSSIISTTVHPIGSTLGVHIAEDPRKCSVKCEVFRMSGSLEKRETWPCRALQLTDEQLYWIRGQAINPLRTGMCWTGTALVLLNVRTRNFLLPCTSRKKTIHETFPRISSNLNELTKEGGVHHKMSLSWYR